MPPQLLATTTEDGSNPGSIVMALHASKEQIVVSLQGKSSLFEPFACKNSLPPY